MPDSPTQSTEVPEEAYEAAYAAVRGVAKRRSHHTPMPDGVTTTVHSRAAVDAAAAAIRNQERQRIQEALRKRITYLRSEAKSGRELADQSVDPEDARKYRIRAGSYEWAADGFEHDLDTLDPSGEERRLCPDEGTCHHGCGVGECFRVHHCAPLSAYGEEWERETVEAFSDPSGEQGEEKHGCPPQRNAKGGLTTFGLYVRSLRWAVGYIDQLKPRRFRTDERPSGTDGDDWLEWAGAHDLLKDASAPATDPSKEERDGE